MTNNQLVNAAAALLRKREYKVQITKKKSVYLVSKGTRQDKLNLSIIASKCATEYYSQPPSTIIFAIVKMVENLVSPPTPSKFEIFYDQESLKD